MTSGHGTGLISRHNSEETQIDTALKRQLWAIGGGKGGVGKSLTTLLLGVTLTRWGKKVIIVDADLGGSNIHILAGIHSPQCTLADFLERRVENIGDIALDTPVKNLRVICGADDILGMANPKSSQTARLLNNLKSLDADIILLDLGAGTSYPTMDFYLFAPHKIVILTPQATSIQNAYGFIKSCLLRKLTRDFSMDAQCTEIIKQAIHSPGKEKKDIISRLKEDFLSLGEEYEARLSDCVDEMKIGLIVNMVRESKDVTLGRSLLDVTAQYLSLSMEYMGFIEEDKRLINAVNNMPDFMKEDTGAMTEMGFYDLASRVIKKIYKESKGITG
jgi:flagellar biosynthesis protein FlhG